MGPESGLREALLRRLADGYFHSGQALAESLGVSRAAVWQHIQRLEALGLDIYRVPGRGYRLAAPLDLLQSDRIAAALPPAARRLLRGLQVFLETDSTSERLLRDVAPAPAACFAEYQTAGRGRRGRQWVTPLGGQLAFSVSWVFASLPPDFSALALAVGIGVATALRAEGATGVALKWPNDLVADGRKLGGILVEVTGEPPGRTRVVAGVGVNWRIPADTLAALGQPACDLAGLCGGGEPPPRNRLAATCLASVLAVFDRFAREGFRPFRSQWSDFDALQGRDVTVSMDAEQVHGRAAGVDAAGALRLETDGGLRRFMSGDVSVRVRE